MKKSILKEKQFKLMFTLLCFVFSSSFIWAQTIISPDGYAAYQGTTGGGNASPVNVSSASALKTAVSGSSSKVIIVNGRIDLGGNVTIGSNTTLIGANSSSGLYNGSVLIQGTNYIIQNLNFGPASGDVMEVSGATKVFITKCSFHDSSDELCSIVRASDYVTVSWCKFYFDNPDSHSFAHLIGNSDGATGDRGKLHVTMHHNWYANGVKGRQPRVRFGYVHLYNNYYNSNNSGYCIGVGYECHIRIENTHFDNINSPWADYGGTSNGQIGWTNLKFEGCSQPTFVSNSYPVFTPPYSFSLDAVDNVESIVKAGAGNVFGQTETYTLTTSVNGQGSISPSEGSFSAGSVVTLKATPANGWQFNGWSGALSGTTNPASLTMSSNMAVTANFSEATNTTTITIQENETGFCSVDGGIDDNNAGFTGDGFANTDNASGEGITWSVNIPTSGSYSVVLRYANGGSTDRTAQLMEDGSTIVSNISMPSTGSWTTWTETSAIAVNLSAGTKLIRVEATNSSGLANIDYITLSGGSISAVACEGLKSTLNATEIADTKTDMDIKYYPVPVNDLLNIEFSKELTGTVDICVLDIAGKAVRFDKANGSSHILDMSDLPKGFYTVRISGENLNRVESVTKQ